MTSGDIFLDVIYNYIEGARGTNVPEVLAYTYGTFSFLLGNVYIILLDFQGPWLYECGVWDFQFDYFDDADFMEAGAGQ